MAAECEIVVAVIVLVRRTLDSDPHNKMMIRKTTRIVRNW